MPISSAFKRLREEKYEFGASLSYTVSPHLKNKTKHLSFQRTN